MEGIRIHKRPRLKNSCLVVAWPGMGEVAFKSAIYLIESLKAEEFAEIEPADFFYLTAGIVKDGILDLPKMPYGKFYYWKNPQTKSRAKNNQLGFPAMDLIIFLSTAQPDLVRAEEYCRRILYVAKAFKVKLIVSMAAMPQPIEHTQDPNVWFSATSKIINDDLSKFGITPLLEGQISGMNGLFLGIAKREGFPGFCLLGEIPLYTVQIENPRASYAVLHALSRVLNMQADLNGLIEQAHTIEGEIDKLLDYLKIGSQSQPAPIGEEEIEKIKKALSQLTKLPASVKDNIEKLFVKAKADISRAAELKSELDKWNVYKDYEDKFLDLFRKPKDKGN